MEIQLVKKVTKIVFEEKNKYEDEFARQLALNDFQIHKAYQLAFKDIAKVKASVLLQDPRILQIYFEQLLKKEALQRNDIEQEWIEYYEKFIDQFEINPFEAYVFYVENYKDIEKPIARLISDNPAQNIMILGFLYKFFFDIERDYFAKETKARIREEYEQVILISKIDPKIGSNFEAIKKMMGKHKIYFDQITKN